MPLLFPFFVTDRLRPEAADNRLGHSFEFTMGEGGGHAFVGEGREKLFPFVGARKTAAAFVTIYTVDNRYLCIGI